MLDINVPGKNKTCSSTLYELLKQTETPFPFDHGAM